MYPPPDSSNYDPYSGKFKRGIATAYGLAPRPQWTECGVCLVLILMGLTAMMGAVAAWVLLPHERQADPVETQAIASNSQIIASATESPQMPATLPPFAFIPSSTPAPTLTPFPSASPTRQVLLEPSQSPTPRRVVGLKLNSPTPSPFQLPPTQTPIRDSAESPGERFAFFAQNSAIPRSLTVIDFACDANKSEFTLVFDHSLEPNIAYFEITLSAAGPDALLTEITPLITPAMQIVQDLTITLNDTALNLNDVRSSQIFLSIFQSAWDRERLNGVKAFSITWTDTSLQPAMSFRVVGQHPNSGGVMMAVRWARDPNQPLQDNERLSFQVC